MHCLRSEDEKAGPAWRGPLFLSVRRVTTIGSTPQKTVHDRHDPEIPIYVILPSRVWLETQVYNIMGQFWNVLLM